MASFVALIAFLCILGKLSALGEEGSQKVVVFGNDFAVESDEEAIDSDSVVWRVKGQDPVAVKVQDRKCQCSGSSSFQCKCCANIRLGFFKMDACAGFTFNPSAKALEFTVTVNGRVVFKKTISVNTPVKFCHDFSIHGKDVKICVGLSDISFEKGHTGACIYMEISYHVFHWKQKLGCVYKDVKPKNKITRLNALDFF